MLERIASNPPGVASPTTRVIAAELGLWISVESAGGGVLVVPRGELDHETVSMFAHCLDSAAAAGCSPVRVDLSEVSYLGVAGYRAIVRFGERCRRDGVDVTWVHPSGAVRLLFGILGEPAGDTVAGPSTIASAS